MAITVNDSTVAQGGIGNFYDNEPTVSVTLCNPGTTTNCVVISHVLLDTGSYGLRLFQSAITAANAAQGKSVTPTPITNGSSTLAECVTYGDNSSQWGPVAYATVQMGNEAFVKVPILVIDSTYQSPPTL